MNLFLLAACPRRAAQLQCDKHVRKMVVETAQLLYAALVHMGMPCTRSTLDEDGNECRPYVLINPSHPAVLWAAACYEHFNWVLQHGMALAEEHISRFHTTNKSTFHLETIAMHAAIHRAQMPVKPPGPFCWLDTLTEKQADACNTRLAFANTPDGCDFAVLCMEEECRADIDAVASYRHFYVHKAKHKFPMSWRGVLHAVPDELVEVFANTFPEDVLMAPPPPKPPKTHKRKVST